MKNLFNSVQMKRPPSNVFDLTHDVKLTGKMGNLIPVCLLETVPGDNITMGSEFMARLAPMDAPIMHRVDVTIHYFFVPNRILWENWEKFITNSEVVSAPFITIDGSQTLEEQRLANYLGIPFRGVTFTPTQISALPFAAYQACYNEYYRDQNLITEVDYKLQDGDNTLNGDLTVMRKRSWEHDYFTSCLPFAQKGAAVDIPLGEVVLRDDWSSFGSPKFLEDPLTIVSGDLTINDPITGEIVTRNQVPPAPPTYSNPLAYDPDGTLQVTATTINELRRSMRLQEWLEKNARGGTRYAEHIRAHFATISSDARLQRPEYITGVKQPLQISEVVQTSETDTTPQGTMAGHGIAVGGNYSKKYFCEEHGYIIGILSVMPKTAYQQGIHKSFSRFDPLDYYWPSFANIGEQEVKLQELFAGTNNKDLTFGYVPRYAEYKFMNSRVCGDFEGNLDYWHLGRIFANEPTLTGEFLEVTDEDVERIFPVQGEDYLYMQVLNKILARRPMPVYGTPQF